jgi:hypothetical protein
MYAPLARADRRRITCGQSLVEFAILILPLTVLLIGTIKIADAVDTSLLVADAARLGARFGAQRGQALDNATTTAVNATVTNLLRSRGVLTTCSASACSGGGLCCQVTPTDVDPPHGVGMPLTPQDLQVIVRLTYPLLKAPVFGLPVNVTISNQAQFPRKPNPPS